MTTVELNSSRYQAPDGWISPHSLYLCRTRMNLTPPQVEELTGISAELISKWEQSKETPSLEQLEILAKHYRCPVGYFFIAQPPKQFPETINFRGLTRERFENLSYKSRLKIDEFITLTDTLTDIVRESNISISPDIPIRNLDDDIKEPVILLCVSHREFAKGRKGKLYTTEGITGEVVILQQILYVVLQRLIFYVIPNLREE